MQIQYYNFISKNKKHSYYDCAWKLSTRDKQS